MSVDVSWEKQIKEFFSREGRLYRSETQMFIKKGRTLEKELMMVKKKKNNLLLIYGQWCYYCNYFLKRSLVFPILLFSSISLHWSLMKAFLSLLAILWNSAYRCLYLSFSPLLFTSLLFTAICRALVCVLCNPWLILFLFSYHCQSVCISLGCLSVTFLL